MDTDSESSGETDCSVSHTCYIIKSVASEHVYIGYTTDFSRRLRQHNREIKGGAKHTFKYYPYYPICVVRGFPNAYTARSFEWHLQHRQASRKRVYPRLTPVLKNLQFVVLNGGGSVTNDTLIDWPNTLELKWHVKGYMIKGVTNTH